MPGQTGTDSSFGPLIGEGGGAGGVIKLLELHRSPSTTEDSLQCGGCGGAWWFK